jgi:hypothetical protein
MFYTLPAVFFLILKPQHNFKRIFAQPYIYPSIDFVLLQP